MAITNILSDKSVDVLRRLRIFYMCALTVYTICREVIPLEPIITLSICSLAFFGAGLALIVLTFLIQRNYFNIENKCLLIAFVGVCIISTLVNFRFSLFSNIKAICWICIYLFLVYPACCKDHNSKKKTINAVFITAVITMLILVAVSLPMYFNNIDYTYYKTTGALTNQGFSREYLRLWGVFQEANYGGVYACVTLLMGCYLIKEYKNIFARAALVVANVLKFVFIVLSGSRTAMLVFVLVGAWAGFYAVASKLKGIAMIKKIALALVAGAVSAAMLLCVFSAVKTALPIVKKGVSAVTSDEVMNSTKRIYDKAYTLANVNIIDGLSTDTLLNEPSDPAPPVNNESSLIEGSSSDITSSDVVSSENVTSDGASSESIQPESSSVPSQDEPSVSSSVSSEPSNQYEELTRPDMEKKEDISNGRFRRWMDGIKIFLKAPVLGASPRGITAFAREYCPDTYVAKYYYSIASTYIEVAAAIGIIGVLIVLALFIKTIMMVLKKAFNKKCSFRFLVLSAVVLFLAASSVLQCDLFFNLTFGGVSFWLVLGALFAPEKEETDRSGKADRVLVYGLKDPAGGVEKIILDYTKALSENGVTFDFIFFGEKVSFEDEIMGMGGRCIYLPSKIKKYFEYVKATKKLFENNKYSAVWGNYSGLTNIDLLVFAEKYSVPVRIAHSHVSRLYWGSALAKYIVIFLNWFNKQRVSFYATHYFGCSKEACEFMFPKSVHSHVSVVRNAVNIYEYHPKEGDWSYLKEELGFEKGDVIFGHVARMCAAKNQIFLLDVMKAIITKNPVARLIFVGDGELKEEIIAYADKIGISQNVAFLGTRNDVFDLMQIIDVFLLPSLSEGLGLSAIEAQACGIPCVVSTAVPPIADISGMVEFVDFDAEKWAEKALRLVGERIENPTEKIIANGYEITSASEGVMVVLAGEEL